ncbi:MAG: tRNA threonylcarbamoyladenosine dehydratase [Clostridia bacterium]|nr:tRNA threonylcarbamoyladenosine dehydratase [Clostridia bacterium]
MYVLDSDRFARTRMLIGDKALDKLKNSRVLLFGLGGVSSYTAEALARAGVGNISLVDSDTVAPSNLNRQLCALESTVGRYKTEVVAERIQQINPDCNVTVYTDFYLPGSDIVDFTAYDYVADAIDTVKAKLDIAEKCINSGVPVISCMGTGNKLDPSLFRVSDISKTEVCPLCKVIRYELRKRGINHLNVVWSPENPIKPAPCEDNNNGRTPASISFVPGAAGLIMAGKIITDLCKE